MDCHPTYRVSKPAGDQPERRAGRADAAPDAQRLVALGALFEHVHHDRERGRQHDRGAKPLNAAHRDQESIASGERAGQRCRGENAETHHEDAAAAEQIGRAAAQQQEAAERQPVRGDHPLQVRLGEVQLSPDGRQRHVDDRQVDDGHEERNGEDGEGAPAVDGRHRKLPG